MRRIIAAAAALLVIVRLSGAAAPQKADIDPNALADGLMAFMGAEISDSTDLTDDSEADAEEARNQMYAAANRHWEEERDEKKQNEDVVPISGDSSGAPDEILDGGAPGFQLVSLLTPRPAQTAALQRPFVVFTGFRDGVSQMRIFSPRGLSATVRARLPRIHFVLEPLGASGKKTVENWLARVAPRGSGVHVTSLPVRGYCVDAAKLPPEAGDTFIVAPRAAQEQFKPAKMVRIVAEYAAAHGYLRPQGDAATYGRFIAQYAMWTSIEHWDEARFTNELIGRTKREMAAAKKPWTSETEQTLRALAPARWRDVQLVIGAATKVDQRRRVAGGRQ